MYIKKDILSKVLQMGRFKDTDFGQQIQGGIVDAKNLEKVI